MSQLSQDDMRAYLRANGVPMKAVETVISGFDFSKPVYTQSLEPGQELYQFMRNPSYNDSSVRAGNWFCLRGATTNGLAIFGGGAGRRLHAYAVSLSLTAIEGTACSQSRNWSWAGGGEGGATQIYIPPALAGRLNALGPHDDW